MNASFSISGGLAESQLEGLHQRALVILEKTGLEVTNPEIQAFFTGRPGFYPDGTRLRFAPRLIEECAAQSRRLGREREMQAAPAPWQLSILSAYPTHLADPFNGGIRPMTEVDVIAMTRLVDVLHDQGVRGSTAGVPQDVPPQVRDIRCFRIGAENCREGGYAPISTLQSAEWLYRLAGSNGTAAGAGCFYRQPAARRRANL